MAPVEHQPSDHLASFWATDRRRYKVLVGAFGFALGIHSGMYFAADQAPKKKEPETITMAIALPPPPPPPPDVVETPPPPKPRKPPPEAPPAPAAPATPAPPTPADAPPPKASEVPVNLGPSTGQGVAVAVGSPDGVEGAAPIKGEGSKPLETNRAVAGPDTDTWDPNGYRSNAHKLMDKNKRYPRKAEVMGIEGSCVVVLVIARDGSLAEPPRYMGKGTGNADLDAECLEMAKRVGKFPPIPASAPAPHTLRLKIEFHLENR
jgi:periplasmic protein TonB